VVSTPEGDIRITSVAETNSLLIQATQTQYSSIQAAIERIDEEPLQVLIEAQILDVELNEDLQFGVNWFLTENAGASIPGSPDGAAPISEAFNSALSEAFNSALLGASNNFFATITSAVGSGFVNATISALDSVTDVRSLGAPSLLVRNNATATITVGTQVPVQSSSISTGNSNVISSAQYVSTGITLTVTPRINPGGLVYMDVSQEVSRPGARDPDISTSGNPPINNKSVTSQVAVQSGQTIFLGGLISEHGARTKSTVRSETIVMITPTVIESTSDLKVVSDDIRTEFMKIPPIEHTVLQGKEE